MTKVHGLLWTLIFVGPKRGSWGFWVPQEDRGADCIPWHIYRGIEDPGLVLAERSAMWGS